MEIGVNPDRTFLECVILLTDSVRQLLYIRINLEVPRSLSQMKNEFGIGVPLTYGIRLAYSIPQVSLI